MFPTAKVDKTIKIFTPNGLILQEYRFIYHFPAINGPNIIHRRQISTLNHLHVNFVVPGTNTLYTKREILARGILTGGSPSDKLFSAVFANINLKDIIVLDYLLFKYMIGNHHSLQLIRICFEINYIDQYERIIEDAPVLFPYFRDVDLSHCQNKCTFQ